MRIGMERHGFRLPEMALGMDITDGRMEFMHELWIMKR